MEEQKQYSREEIQSLIQKSLYSRKIPTYGSAELYKQIKPSIPNSTTSTGISGLISSYVTQNQSVSLQGIMIQLQHEVLEQREQIDILTKAVEQLLEQKLETFKKHE